MDLQHTFTVPTSIDDAWALFMDIERVGNCFPGGKVTEATEDAFSGTAKVKLGPIVLLYAGSGTFIERDDSAYRAVLQAKGKDKRGNGTAGATVTIQLSADGEGTRADVSTELAITGKPAQFGRGVMQDVSDKLLEQFSGCIERQLSPMTEAEAGVGTQTATAEGTATPVTDGLGEAPEDLTKVETPADRLAKPLVSPAAEAEHDAVDLGAAILPVLVRRYAGLAAAATGGFVIGWLFGRRRRRG